MRGFWTRGKLKIFLIVVASVLLGLVAALGVLWWGFESRFHQAPKPAVFPAPQGRVEGMRQDLDYLGELANLDHSFSQASRDAFERERQRLMAQTETLSPGAFDMAVSHAVALAGNGHTSVFRRSRRMGRVPIRLAWFEEGLFVVRASEADAGLLGARVVTINGMTPENMLPVMTPFLSGTADNAKALSPLLYEMPAALAGVWPAMSAERETLVLRAADGREQEVELAADDPAANVAPLPLERNLAPQPAPGEAAGWRALLADGRDERDLPWSLLNPDASLYSRRLDSGKGIYINLRKIEDDDKGPLSDQLAGTLRDIEPASLRYAIVDLRFDSGGNYMTTLSFSKQLPKKLAPDGKLFILTNEATFSAAIVTLARLKYFAGGRAMIVGEHVGDREQFWAENAEPLVLPNSKIYVSYATGYHDWAAGCHDTSRCFWLNFLFDVPAGSLAPDVKVAWRFADYRENRDTVLEAALKFAKSSTIDAPRPAGEPRTLP